MDLNRIGENKGLHLMLYFYIIFHVCSVFSVPCQVGDLILGKPPSQTLTRITFSKFHNPVFTISKLFNGLFLHTMYICLFLWCVINGSGWVGFGMVLLGWVGIVMVVLGWVGIGMVVLGWVGIGMVVLGVFVYLWSGWLI